MSDNYIGQTVYLTPIQKEWIDKKAINLSKYVRNVIKEDMKKDE